MLSVRGPSSTRMPAGQRTRNVTNVGHMSCRNCKQTPGSRLPRCAQPSFGGLGQRQVLPGSGQSLLFPVLWVHNELIPAPASRELCLLCPGHPRDCGVTRHGQNHVPALLSPALPGTHPAGHRDLASLAEQLWGQLGHSTHSLALQGTGTALLHPCPSHKAKLRPGTRAVRGAGQDLLPQHLQTQPGHVVAQLPGSTSMTQLLCQKFGSQEGREKAARSQFLWRGAQTLPAAAQPA